MGSPSYLRIKLCIDAATVRNQAAAAPAPADAAPVALAAIARVTPASIEPLSPPVDEHLMRANEAASREMAVDARIEVIAGRLEDANDGLEPIETDDDVAEGDTPAPPMRGNGRAVRVRCYTCEAKTD